MDEKNKRLENTLDFYNEKMTKKAVGRLFQEYIDEGERNYFIPDDEDEYDNRYEEPKKESYYDNESFNNNSFDNQAFDENYDELEDEYSAYMQDEEEEEDYDDIDVDYNKNFSYDTVKLYSPRRKRSTKSKSSRKDKNRYDRISERPSDSTSKRDTTLRQTRSPRTKFEQPEVFEDDYNDSNGLSKLIIVALSCVSLALLIAVIILSYKLNVVNSDLKYLNEKLNATTSTPIGEQIEAQNNSQATGTSTNEVPPSTQNVDINQSSSSDFVTQDENYSQATQNNNLLIDEDVDTTTSTNEIDNSEAVTSTDVDNTEEEASSTPSSYTVVKGDNAWKISKKMYGSGDYYLNILEANGMDENSALVIGQELVIPEI